MADDVLVNKAAAIERAVRRAREEYAGDDRNLLHDRTRQDSIVLNLQRACESSIDAAMHLVRVRRLGVPQETREAFVLLEQAHLIEPQLADRLSHEQRRTLVDKLPDAANLALGALVFGQFLEDRPFSRQLATAGIGIWLVLLVCALLLGRRQGRD